MLAIRKFILKCQPAGEAGRLLWASAFAAACRDHEFCRVGKFDHPMSEHGRRKIRLWQAACSLVVFVPAEETEAVILRCFDLLVVGLACTRLFLCCLQLLCKESEC